MDRFAAAGDPHDNAVRIPSIANAPSGKTAFCAVQRATSVVNGLDGKSFIGKSVAVCHSITITVSVSVTAVSGLGFGEQRKQDKREHVSSAEDVDGGVTLPGDFMECPNSDCAAGPEAALN